MDYTTMCAKIFRQGFYRESQAYWPGGKQVRKYFCLALSNVLALLLPILAAAQQTPHCLLPGTAQNFIQEILPQLRALADSLEIRGRLRPGEGLEDVISFSYELAVTSIDQPLGAWNDQIKNRSAFYMYFISAARTAGSLFALPEKDQQYTQEMSNVRPDLVRGSYNRLIVKLAIRRTAFQLTPELVRAYGKLPPVQETIDIRVIEDLRRQAR